MKRFNWIGINSKVNFVHYKGEREKYEPGLNLAEVRIDSLSLKAAADLETGTTRKSNEIIVWFSLLGIDPWRQWIWLIKVKLPATWTNGTKEPEQGEVSICSAAEPNERVIAKFMLIS